MEAHSGKEKNLVSPKMSMLTNDISRNIIRIAKYITLLFPLWSMQPMCYTKKRCFEVLPVKIIFYFYYNYIRIKRRRIICF